MLNGIYRSKDNGDSWNSINSGIISQQIQAITKSKNGIIYAGTNNGIFRSTDNGDNWTSINSGLSVTDIRSIAVFLCLKIMEIIGRISMAL
jgi:photosystem II stability/assembly factor-like uncharacterized protein